MNRLLAVFLHKLRFQRQLEITVASGIFMLALFSSVAGSWLSNERVRGNLLEQGLHITESLAHQSALALIYASGENAADAVNATLSFPSVISVEIRDAGQHVLLQRSNPVPADFLPPGRAAGAGNGDATQTAATLEAESQDAWRFTAPVYSQSSGSPFNEAAAPELLGYVTVVLSKAALDQMAAGIFAANLSVSFSFALLFLLLIRFLSGRMTRPLNQLSDCMKRAEAGESQVRAVLAGPQDIADMAHAFNSMMSVLEEHAAKIRQLNAELEQRVVQRTAQLEAANKELEDFSYSMSHDMRIPLRALDGFSKLLQEDYAAGMDDEGRRLLKVVRDSARRMGRLVDDILHYLSLGRRKIESGLIDMNELAAECCREMQAAAPERRLRFEIGELPQTWGDRVMLREVWQNLLSNAIKFSPQHNEVLIEITGLAGEGESIYSVTDHGVGFDMRYVDKLFRVFERVHPTGEYEGSAIGLAIIKRIVTRHGGRVWARGRMNEGATFNFALPDKENGNG